MAHFSTLPREVLQLPSDELILQDLCKCSLVCSSWRELSCDDSVWHNLATQTWPNVAARNLISDWKRHYLDRLLPYGTGTALKILIYQENFWSDMRNQILMGEIVIRIREREYKAKYLKVHIVGVEQFFLRHLNIIEEHLTLLAPSKGENCIKISRGITRIPFQVTLPPNPPPSIDIGISYASILYRITAVLAAKKVLGTDHQIERRFYVRTPLRPEIALASAPQQTSRVWQTNDGRIDMEASIPRSHYSLQDVVEINCQIQNNSRLVVSNIRVDFEGCLMNVNTEEYNRAFSWDSNLPAIPSGGNYSGVLRITVPRGACGTIDGYLLRYKWRVKIACELFSRGLFSRVVGGMSCLFDVYLLSAMNAGTTSISGPLQITASAASASASASPNSISPRLSPKAKS